MLSMNDGHRASAVSDSVRHKLTLDGESKVAMATTLSSFSPLFFFGVLL
jgi:hypothetical protein